MEEQEKKAKFIENVANIKMSESTRGLIKCRAKLDDLYNEITEINDKIYGRDIDEIVEDFQKSYFSLRDKFTRLLQVYVDQELTESDYRSM